MCLRASTDHAKPGRGQDSKHGEGSHTRGKRPAEGSASSPEDVDAEVEGEVQEELVEVAQVGGVAVGVEHGGRGVRVAHIHRRQRVPPARAEAQHLDVLPVGLCVVTPASASSGGGGKKVERGRERQMRGVEREDAFVRRRSLGRQNGSRVCVSHWRAFFRCKNTAATHFGFGFPSGSAVGDSLMG